MQNLREGEKPSAPANLVLPKPVAIPRRDFITKGGAVLVLATGSSAVMMEGCNANQWIQIALTDLPTIIQVITGIVSIAKDPSVSATLEAELQKVAAEITKDVNDIKGWVNQYKATPTSGLLSQIDAALLVVQNNLSTILADFHVANPVLVNTVAASIGLAITTVLAIQALVPPPPAATTARLSMQKNNGANAILEAFNVIVTKNYPNAAIPVPAS